MSLIFDKDYKKYIDEIRTLYYHAFPAYERRKAKDLKELLNKGKYQILAIINDGVFVGFFMLMKNTEVTLIDYFAIRKDFRGKSMGTRALRKLNQGKPLIIEIEPVDEKSPNNKERIRRKAFYENLGFRSNNILIDWYDTTLELMSLNDDMTTHAYFSLLDQVLGKDEREKYIRIASQR